MYIYVYLMILMYIYKRLENVELKIETALMKFNFPNKLAYPFWSWADKSTQHLTKQIKLLQQTDSKSN